MKMSTQDYNENYQKEVSYQKTMLKNLSHWQSFFSMLVGISILMMYFFVKHNWWLFGTGAVLGILNVVAVFTVGYAIYRGKQNLAKVIQYYGHQN